MAEIFIEVKDLEGPQRLDVYVSQNTQNFTRSRLKNGVEKILVNNKNAKLSAKVSNGDKIFIQWEDPIPQDITPENIVDSEPLFGAGLGLDSIDALELGVGLKKKFGVKFSSESADNKKHFASVDALAEYIKQARG